MTRNIKFEFAGTQTELLNSLLLLKRDSKFSQMTYLKWRQNACKAEPEDFVFNTTLEDLLMVFKIFPGTFCNFMKIRTLP